MGTIYYGTGNSATHLHADKECPQLGYRRTHPLKEYDLEETNNRKLCRTCVPDQPRQIRTFHARCKICAQTMPLPCEHNGGVLVTVPVRYRVPRQPGEHEEIRFSRKRVWPENVHRYATLANPSHRV